jgi:glucose/arabinose dehydrogenase
VSSIASVFAYDYDAAAGTVGTKKAVITGMSIPGPYHLTRTLRIPQSDPNILIVQRGSDGNIDTSTVQASSGKSQVRIFKISDILANPVDYSKSGTVLGFGLRNSVGWAQHPITHEIVSISLPNSTAILCANQTKWSVENSADDIKKGGKDVHTNNPAEELNFHGLFNDSSNPLLGANFGYPACFSTWDATSFGTAVGVQTMIDMSVGSPTQEECAKRIAPKLVFPAHTAPVDIKFKKDGSAAFVTFHGSW